MKWLFLLGGLRDIGGLKVRGRRIAEELLSRGHEVHILYYGPDRALAGMTDRWPACRLRPVARRDAYRVGPAQLHRAWRELAAIRPDVVWGYFSNHVRFGAYLVASRLQHVANVLVHHGNMPKADLFLPRASLRSLLRWENPRRTLEHLAAGTGCRAVTAALYNNCQQMTEWRRTGLYPRARHLLWWPPVPSEFAPDGEVDQAERPFTIAAVGSLVEQKGHEDLITAAAMLKTRPGFENARLLLLGDGKLREGLIELSHQLGIRDSVQFTGYVDDVASHLRRVDLFAFPSINHNETCGIALAEALAMGLPVVATALPGPERIVEHGRLAVLVPPRNPEKLAEALWQLAGSPEKRERLRAEARSVADRFAPSAIVDSLLGRIFPPAGAVQ